jgi:hypothetical protein
MLSGEVIQKAISQVKNLGFCILRNHFDPRSVEACRNAFWPRLIAYLSSGQSSNRGPYRYYLAMPFEPPCFSPQFYFDPDVLAIVRGLMDDRIAADQWGCDVPIRGSQYQNAHVDYQRPLFPELPSAVLPAHAIVVSFGLVRITPEHGPIEIAPGTHRLTRIDAPNAVEAGQASMRAIPLEVGDVLVRHPWALHRGRPNAAMNWGKWTGYLGRTGESQNVARLRGIGISIGVQLARNAVPAIGRPKDLLRCLHAVPAIACNCRIGALIDG